MEVNIAPMEEALTRSAGTKGQRPYSRGPNIKALLSMPVLDLADIFRLRKRLLNAPYAQGYLRTDPDNGLRERR